MAEAEKPWVGQRILGIDLGTTKSVMALWDPSNPTTVETLRNAEGEERTPSVVAWDRASREWRVGTPALEIGKQSPQDMVYSVKRLLGRGYKDPVVERWKDKFNYAIQPGKYVSEETGAEIDIVLGQDPSGKALLLKAEQVAALILRKLRLDAQDILLARGVPPEEATIHYAVITVPAYFNLHQRAATQRAAQLAGFDAAAITSPTPDHTAGLVVTRLLDEPTAAALTFKHAIDSTERRVLIYDLGGGTFDISLLRCQRDDFGYQMEVEFLDGNTDLGGDHIDQRLVLRAQQALSAAHPVLNRLDDVAVRERLRQALEKAKRELNDDPQATSQLVSFTAAELGAVGGGPYEFVLTQDVVDECAEPTVTETLDILQTRMDEEDLSYADIDRIILVGGPTQMRYLRTRVAQATGKTLGEGLLAHDKPQLVVGQGAGAAAMLDGNPRGQGLRTATNLMPILPQTLSILGGENFKDRRVLLPAKRSLPAHVQDTVKTLESGQKRVVIPIVQATRAQERKNEYTPIDEVTLDILPAPAEPVLITVIFDITVEGRFTVTVKDERGAEVTKEVEGGRTKVIVRSSGQGQEQHERPI